MTLYEQVKSIILTNLDNESILDFNKVLCYLKYINENQLKEIKKHKWNLFVRNDFLKLDINRNIPDIKCINCSTYFTTIYNRVIYNKDITDCNELMIKKLLE